MIKSTLAQVFPAPSVLTEAYKVPLHVSALITNILICNHDPVPNSFSLAFSVLSAVDNPAQYWFKNQDILPNETIDLD